jgi:glucose-1-phosphate thymidylyltransferase
MLADIREILVITIPQDQPAFQRLLRDGSQWGLHFTYAVQPEPRGLADAFLVGREFIGGEPVCLILGDNLFFGHGLPEKLRAAAQLREGALIFAYPVRDPQRHGVVEFDASGRALSIEEKPDRPRSQYAVPGLYFFDRQVVGLAEKLKPSLRGELEITDLNQEYLSRGALRVEALGRGVAWLDAGSPESLLQAATFVQAVEERQGLMIACPEEIAFRQGYLTRAALARAAQELPDAYGDYLRRLLDDGV